MIILRGIPILSSIKKNIAANYASQIYTTLIAMIMTPMYVRYLGIESYGLIGFFTMLQAWFQFLDIGLSPTMARQTAQFRGGALSGFDLRCLLRALEYFFMGMACLGSLSLLLASGYLSQHWLKVQSISFGDVQLSVQLIAIIVALRWVCGLYRGIANGFEQFVWLSKFNIMVATAKFVLVILIFAFISKSIKAFFIYQLILAIIELSTLIFFAYKILPPIKSEQRVTWQWSVLRGVLKFSVSIAFTTMIWILITQSDKLILSKFLTLTDYGYFSLAVLVASGINAMTGPIGSALLPRLAKVSSEGSDQNFVRLYRKATQLLCVVATPITLVIALFSEQVLSAWTGDSSLASKACSALMLYALGNGVLAIAALPYYLQFAKGDLKLHVIGNLTFIIFFIPALILATINYGMLGSGYVWLSLNMIYFLLWTPLVHHKFMPGLHLNWLVKDVFIPTLPTVMLGLLLKQVIIWPAGRTQLVFQLILISFLLVIFSVAQSSTIRQFITYKWPRRPIIKELQ